MKDRLSKTLTFIAALIVFYPFRVLLGTGMSYTEMVNEYVVNWFLGCLLSIIVIYIEVTKE